MAFSRYLLVLAMVVLVATSNYHQAFASTYTCVNVQAALSLPCVDCATGVLTVLLSGLLGGLSPTGPCCTNVKTMYDQCLTAQLDITTCLPLCNLSLAQLCAIFKTCGVSAAICINV